MTSLTYALHRLVRTWLSLLVTATLFSGNVGLVWANEGVLDQEDNSTLIHSGGTIFEMEVIGQNDLSRLRMNVEKAEENVYAVWNELVDDRRYRIQCEWVAPTGSTIKRKTCYPAFVGDANASNAQAVMYTHQEGLFSMPPGYAGGDFSRHYRRFQAKMREMAEENPDFLEAIADHYHANEALKDARSEYFRRNKD